MSGDGRGCSDNGSLDVRDVHTDASGNIDRLWLLYQLHCQSSGWPASFGEVRLNEPASDANPSAEPTAVQWPDADVGRPTRVVPITVFAGPTARQVSSVALAGADAQA